MANWQIQETPLEVRNEMLLYAAAGGWVMAMTLQTFFTVLAFFATETPKEMRRPLSLAALGLAIASALPARILLNFRSDAYGAAAIPASDLAIWVMMTTMLLGFFTFIVFALTFGRIWR